MNTYNHKRGDSLTLLVNLPEQIVDGHFLDWTLASQVRTPSGTLIANLNAEWVDPLTTRTIKLEKLDTTTWPIGKLEMDIQMTSLTGFVTSTSTVTINVQKDITRA